MCTQQTQNLCPDNAFPALLLVKGTDGELYPISPVTDISAIQNAISDIHYKLNSIGLNITYDQTHIQKPSIEEYTAIDPESDILTNRAYYDYKINDGYWTYAPLQSNIFKRNGEIYIYPDLVLASNVSLPCTITIGRYLYYFYGNGSQGYGEYYAICGGNTLEITEPGTYHAEKFGGNFSIGKPAAWQGFTTELIVTETSNNLYTITATDFCFYTSNAKTKYQSWTTRPKATTLTLSIPYSLTQSVDLTKITDDIYSLEQRVAELEALHNNE